MNLKLLRPLTFVFCLVITGLSVKAQTSETQYFVPQPFPRSPTATALEKYGTYQVNEFTGVPDISIPLYTVEAGGFQVPITLSYHASGNKVTDVASWCGLGWSVSAGGQISRRVYGTPDDGPGGYLYGNMKASGTVNDTLDTDVIYLEGASNGSIDTKPDIYSYDFPGGSGKFFFDGSAANGTYPVRLLPYAPVKIQYAMNKHFTVTDEHGNRYLYGDLATDTTSSSTGGKASITVPSAWKLENMVSQNRRDTVSFTYFKNSIKYPLADGETYSVTDQLTYYAGNQFFYHSNYLTPPTTPGNLDVTLENVPTQINFKNGKVVFDLDASVRTDINVGFGGPAYGLADMKVYNYNYGTKTFELQKTVVFWKSYFTNSAGTKRLRLDSIQVLDKAGSVMQRYSFDYNTAIQLPDYTSTAQDYWGYFNNVNNSMLTPQQSIPYQPCPECTSTYVTIGSDHANGRACDSTQMQAYMLTGIHYPTGGYSTFTYQTNRYFDLGVMYLTGGLRVSSISSYDGISPTPIVKTYVYNTARANFNLSSDYFVTQQLHQDWEEGPFDKGSVVKETAVIRSFASNPHTDLEGFDGAPVVYPSVTEYIGTPGTNVGRTDYLFTDAQDTLLMASMSGAQIYASAFYRRGHLRSKDEFIRKSDGTYQKVKSLFNTYTAFPPSMYPNVACAVFKTVYNEGSAGGNPMFVISMPPLFPDDRKHNTFLYPYYNISSDDNYMVSTTSKTYDTIDTTKYSASTVTYHYDDTTHQQIATTTHTDSKGNTHITTNKHAYDYLSGGTTHNILLDSMISRHMYADVVEKYDSLRNAATSVNSVTGAQLNQYELFSSDAVVPQKISTLSVAQPITNFTHSSIVSGALTGDSRYVQMISFDNYDANNNLLQYTARNSTPVSILWDYKGENPIAQVKNSVYANIAYTSFEADGKGNWNYSGTPLFDPTAPTGNMVYPLGTGNITSFGFSSALAYVVSYWSKGSAATVTPYGGSPVTGTALNSANGWTYYEHQIPSGTTQVTISGSATIDELRLYPSNAQMTTYAYDPSGVRSISDTKGANSYFEYDFLQRLKNIKDWNGNIVKNYGYHIYNQTVGNQVQTATFTRNNCPYGTTPGSLSFTVPANKYYGTSQASANADATYDMNVNGQIKANTNCGCPILYIDFTLSNTSGFTGYQATFSGIGTPFNFPSTGSIVIHVPENTYSTVSISSSSNVHTFSLTGYTDVVGHSATFNNVAVVTGSNLYLIRQAMRKSFKSEVLSLESEVHSPWNLVHSPWYIVHRRNSNHGHGLWTMVYGLMLEIGGKRLEIRKSCHGLWTMVYGLLLALCANAASAQTQTNNYVITKAPRIAGITNDSLLTANSGDKTKVQTTIQYVDGLGRPIQTIQKQASPLGYDMIQPQIYDQYGREVTKYLPYTPQTGTAGTFRTSARTDDSTFYASPPGGSGVTAITDPYAQTAFDNSPLGRTVEQGAPGVPWQLTGVTGGGHTVKMVYTLNNATSFSSDSVNGNKAAMYYSTINSNLSQTLVAGGYYPAGALTVTISKDENWVSGRAGTVEEYKDIDGHVVLKRVYNYTGGVVQQLSTYYVYDDLGRLAFVLPPASGADGAGTINAATLNNLCYQYLYDERGRPIQKRLPGKGKEFTVYNIMDQPVATQDSLQRANNIWVFTKYDALGRVVMTGTWNHGGTLIQRGTLQTTLNAIVTNLYESSVTTGNGYTNVAWPTSSVTATLSINYYDGYANMPGMPSAYTAPAGANLATRGQLTGTQTNVLGTSNMLWTAHYYDYWGRNLESYAQHYLGGTANSNNYDAITNTYDFTNAPTTSTRKHWTSASTSNPLVTIYNKYIYDWVGRKQKTWEQITNTTLTPDTMRLVSNLIYNEIGQQINKKLHSKDSVNFLQTITYTYNERGWLFQNSAPLFAMILYYNTQPNKAYNGNIMYQYWGTPGNLTNHYTYAYDRLNRLTSGITFADNYKETGITYDLMGNITALNRYQAGTQIDQLTYTYSSTNQVQTVADANASNSGLVSGTTTYSWDGNGNMLSSTNTVNTAQNKSFTYNLLNLPIVATVPNGTVTYTYDAAGSKLRKVAVINGITTVTDYIGGIQYKTNSTAIDFIQTEEGKAVPYSTNSFDYTYYLGDNLGNTRVTFDTRYGIASSQQQDDYYPFGLEINRTITSPKNEYLYNKKELQEEFAEEDYGARFYDPVIARWTAFDPKAEIDRRWSPYAYGFDNAIIFEDPDGMWPDWGDLAVGAIEVYTGYVVVSAGISFATVTSPTVVGALGGAAVAGLGAGMILHGASKIADGFRKDGTKKTVGASLITETAKGVSKKLGDKNGETGVLVGEGLELLTPSGIENKTIDGAKTFYDRGSVAVDAFGHLVGLDRSGKIKNTPGVMGRDHVKVKGKRHDKVKQKKRIKEEHRTGME